MTTTTENGPSELIHEARGQSYAHRSRLTAERPKFCQTRNVYHP
jgi:hypothetical protein